MPASLSGNPSHLLATHSALPEHLSELTAPGRLFELASEVMPGGVNSPVRAFGSVGGVPPFIARAAGAYIYDTEDRRYIDYVGSWGPMLLGHAHPEVVQAVRAAAEQGLSFGAPTRLEVAMAETICALVPSIESVRMVNSGTEATMSAIRLARGFTGRDDILKFEGCYHGHADSLLVKAGSGALTLGIPNSPGVPEDFARHTLTLPYNDAEALTELFRQRGETLACVIIEPIAGNMNFVQPLPGYLDTLRTLCSDYGTVLIFDEVMTGFRVAAGGAQEYYGVTPDLTTLGKIIGGGMPVGAFGGRRDIMEKLAPVGPVYQAGTLSGNPIAMSAGLVTLRLLSEAGLHEKLHALTGRLLGGLTAAARRHGIPFSAAHAGGMFGCFFTDADPVSRFDQVMGCNQTQFRQFFHHMLDGGIYLAPSAFEAGFTSTAHSDADIETTLAVADEAFAALARSA